MRLVAARGLDGQMFPYRCGILLQAGVLDTVQSGVLAVSRLVDKKYDSGKFLLSFPEKQIGRSQAPSDPQKI